MKRSKKRPNPVWSVVATAHTGRGLREASALSPGQGIDFVEVRVDCLTRFKDQLPRLVAAMKIPVIITARHPLEGGVGNLGPVRRGQLLAALMPSAAMLDVELRSAHSLRELLASARKHRVGTILSFHDFEKTPAAATLGKKVREGLRLGASVVKIATTLKSPRDLATLIVLQGSSQKITTMGMGPLGKISRLVLPAVGARLVYGYLDRPQVAGQWPAKLLAARLAEIAP